MQKSTTCKIRSRLQVLAMYFQCPRQKKGTQFRHECPIYQSDVSPILPNITQKLHYDPILPNILAGSNIIELDLSTNITEFYMYFVNTSFSLRVSLQPRTYKEYIDILSFHRNYFDLIFRILSKWRIEINYKTAHHLARHVARRGDL
uniref:Uncharacterized protein n=1 Tax=Arundo donax TaxID=35708 RepID=A0A0A9FY31_ARUDO